ncbi:hypothetical protein M5K25_012617 [Dendrobium thyrsiflorum]|uniref:Uncharacterized protein n=1 Tax=Dendrobium thyrsiflorum TaxID=117978 RepID=A0ABD0UXZ0_DENTH
MTRVLFSSQKTPSTTGALLIFLSFPRVMGIPITSRKLRVVDFSPLLQTVFNMMGNTIAYWIRGSIIPKSYYNFIDKRCVRFLFHGDAQGKKASSCLVEEYLSS